MSGGGGGSITVHSAAACRQLGILPAQGHSEGAEAKREDLTQDEGISNSLGGPHVTLPRSSSRSSRGSPSKETGRLSRVSSAAREALVQAWLTQKARRAVVALPDEPELTEVKELCQRLLQQEQSFIAELEQVLSERATDERSKREMLLAKWTERVFQPLHQQLAHTMQSQQWRTLGRTKANLFQQYLNYRNKKAVFLDTVSADEYNPLSLQSSLTACTGPLEDPLLAQQEDRAVETAICSSRTSVATAQPSEAPAHLDPVSWLAVQLVFIESGARSRARQCVKRDHNQTTSGQKLPVMTNMQGMPHKTPITYPHTPLSLAWPE